MSNNQLAYICDRIQKITEAVYRVTDLLLDREPMKWEIREKSVIIFSVLISLKNDSTLEKNSKVEKIENLIDQLVALLSLFQESKTVSSVNFEILGDEYRSAKTIISKQKQKQHFIKLDLDESALELPEPPKQKQPIGHSNGQNNAIRHNKNSSRKDKILNIIREKKDVSIGELSAVFTEFSEKTIQRDLVSMVKGGILKKQGDKRWRRYFIA
ncbi:DeoR family transcriptional regulator [Patescibacteria group bacterium]